MAYQTGGYYDPGSPNTGNMAVQGAVSGAVSGGMVGLSIGAMGAGAGAAAGATAGSVAGPVGIAIGAVIGLMAGIFSGRGATRKANKAREAQLEAMKARNKANLQEFSRVMGEVYRERAIANMETTSALAHTQKAGASANAQTQNIYASAEQTGNIVQIAKSEVQQNVEETKWQTKFNLETTYENLNAKIMSESNTATGAFAGIQVTEPDKFDVGGAINSIMQGGAMLAQAGMFLSNPTTQTDGVRGNTTSLNKSKQMTQLNRGGYQNALKFGSSAYGSQGFKSALLGIR